MQNVVLMLVSVFVGYLVFSRWARVNAQELKDYNKALENSCEALLDTQAIAKRYPATIVEKAAKYAKK